EFEKAREASEAERLRREAALGRRLKWVSLSLGVSLLFVLALAMLAIARQDELTRLAQAAMKARSEAESQRSIAEQLLKNIKDGINMKQAVLAGDRSRVRGYLDSPELRNRTTRFTANYTP